MHRATLCTCQRRVSSVTLTRTEPESKLDTTRLNSPLEEETLPDTFPLDNFKELGSNWNCIYATFVCQTSQHATIPGVNSRNNTYVMLFRVDSMSSTESSIRTSSELASINCLYHVVAQQHENGHEPHQGKDQLPHLDLFLLHCECACVCVCVCVCCVAISALAVCVVELYGSVCQQNTGQPSFWG
jgi:hypothetical protein